MKKQITVSRTELLNGLLAVSKIISSKSLIVSHENFFFQVVGSKLFVTGADRDGNITTLIELESINSANDFSFIIKHRLLLDGLKALPEQPIVITFDDNSKSVNLKHESGDYNISVSSFEPDDFQMISLNVDEEYKDVIFEPEMLLKSIRKTSSFTSHDDLRPILTGIYIHSLSGENMVNVVGSNANIMAVFKYECESLEQSGFDFIIPLKMAKIICDLADNDHQLLFKIGAKNCLLTFNETTIAFRLIDGRYPAYQTVIPKSNDKELLVDKSHLVGSLKRTSIFSNRDSLLITLELDDNQLTVTGKNNQFQQSAIESLDVQYLSPSITIGFKSEFLLQCLQTIGTDDAKITFKESNTAALLKPVSEDDSEDLTILIMPMMINI